MKRAKRRKRFQFSSHIGKTANIFTVKPKTGGPIQAEQRQLQTDKKMFLTETMRRQNSSSITHKLLSHYTIYSFLFYSIMGISVSFRSSFIFYAVDETANFFKCSMKTCKLTSSVNTGAPPSPPYVNMLLCVCDGLTLERRKRACEPPCSVSM